MKTIGRLRKEKPVKILRIRERSARERERERVRERETKRRPSERENLDESAAGCMWRVRVRVLLYPS